MLSVVCRKDSSTAALFWRRDVGDADGTKCFDEVVSALKTEGV